ncbi:Cytochrome P450 [Mycena sanguinolenta]|uniref:Cytochrome P450 n=1 Tax=Mycena sanguinolenta TaxID=230812 RepID=A0A8H6YFD1_9AGAR|nr:Cytochrome P450 [Mycena sanguinolenta]
MNSGIALAASFAVVVGYLVLCRRSYIRKIPGPPSHSWIYGNMLELALTRTYGEQEFLWQEAYGSVYRFTGCFGEDRLMVSDPLAIQYILNSSHFPLPAFGQNMVSLIFGEHTMIGLRGQTHKRIRNEFNVGFTAPAVRNYQPIFEKFAQAITQQLEAFDASVINVTPPLGQATVAAIAEAALGYSLDELGEEYLTANAQIMTSPALESAGGYLIGTIMMQLPTWLFRAVTNLPTQTFNVVRRARYLARQLGERVVREKKDLILRGLEIDGDIFGLLLDSKHSDITREILTSEEIISQTATVMIAGQETTVGLRFFASTAMSSDRSFIHQTNTIAFGLLELAKNPRFQDELRSEIHSIAGGSPAYDKPLTDRMALRDVVIPLSETITTRTGQRISQIPVRKGQIVTVGIASYQRQEARWGETPHEFRPARWLDGAVSKGNAIGPYSNLLTFLGGAHVCLGWRFAILEMQVVICELVGEILVCPPGR